ncbi:MAG: hypothetical protein ACT4OV_03785 [Microthrixaceae bacterium]
MGLLSERSEDDGERGEISLAGLDIGAVDEIVYDLDEWNERDRSALRLRLETLGLPHRWEDLTLVVSADDEAWVERVMDQVEAELAVTLDPGIEQIAYDLTDWDVLSRERLFEQLEDEVIAFGVDGDEMFVHEIDEHRVDELIDHIVRPDAAGEAPAQPGPEVMGELFVAADRLVHDPLDHEGTLSLIDAIRMASSSTPPYGMDESWWEGVLAHADQLVVLLDTPDPNLDAVVEEATELRDRLRPFV